MGLIGVAMGAGYDDQTQYLERTAMSYQERSSIIEEVM